MSRLRLAPTRHPEFEPGETYGGVQIDDDGDLINPFDDELEEND